MSGRERRYDDDRTGNGIVNQGLEDTPNTDPEQDGERKQDTGTGAVDGAEADSGPAAPDADAHAGPDGEDPRGEDPGGEDPGGGAAHGRAADDRAPDGHDAEDGEGGTLTELFGTGGRGGGASGGSGGFGGSVGGSMDEDALRRMLHGAVGGLEPSDGALGHLYRAVPARRTRRRQGVVGAAAAVLLIGTAVPAFVHVANSDGSATTNSAIAGHGRQAQGGSREDAATESDGERTASPADRRSEGSGGETSNSAAPTQGSAPENERSGTPGPDALPGSTAAGGTACAPDQLGVASADAGAAGADGTVYGTFRIANVSGDTCSVTSNGTVGFQAVGAADPLQITVVQHTAGDPAAGLPDPSLEPGVVVLKPTAMYEVRFAWVPSDTCPTTGSSPSPTPTDGDGGGGGGGGGDTGAETDAGAGTTDTAAQFGSADEGSADGSIAVTHTPEEGAPTAETTITNACAGTIYRTGVLDAS